MTDIAKFATSQLPAHPNEIAPDGSAVRLLLSLTGGSMAHFELLPDEVSRAVAHRSVDEAWFVLAGRGELWRKQEAREEVVDLEPGTCVTVPRGTHFQFRASRSQSVTVLAVTVPQWPGNEEAEFVRGPWTSTFLTNNGDAA